MKGIAIILIFTNIGLVSCKWNKPEKEEAIPEKSEYIEVIQQNYELYKPNKESKAVLVLFGGFGQYPEEIKSEFDILEIARDNDLAVVLTNYKSQLWLEENEKPQLASSLQSIFEDNQLPTDNIFLGGFSSGGIVSLLISDFILGTKQFDIDPKGVFIVDSPVDLSAMYNYFEKRVEQEFSEPAIRESIYFLEFLETNIGNPNDAIQAYEDKSVFTSSTNNTSNLNNLKDIKIRFYTEPDTIWWKENRRVEYEELNAFYIKKLYEALNKQGFNKLEYFETRNIGFQANGERHPHSWSIVDKGDLIKWILKE